MAVHFWDFSHPAVEEPACATQLMRLKIVIFVCTLLVKHDSSAWLPATGRVQENSFVVVFQETPLLQSHFKKWVVCLEIFGLSLVLNSHPRWASFGIDQLALKGLSWLEVLSLSFVHCCPSGHQDRWRGLYMVVLEHAKRRAHDLLLAVITLWGRRCWEIFLGPFGV